MALFAEKEYELRIGDFDRYNRLQPAALLDIFQDVATVQADGMGIGRNSMMEHGVFWIVTRTKYRMMEEPGHHSRVVARTWPHSPSKFSFLRDYRLSTLDGKVIAEGTSEWLLMDAETRKFASVLDYYEGPTDFLEDRAFERKPRKITQLPDESAPELVIVPTFADVDMNGHVNNARYANYALAALHPGEADSIGTFQIDYRQEVREGEPLTLRYQPIEGCPTVAGYDATGEVMFACRIEPRS